MVVKRLKRLVPDTRGSSLRPRAAARGRLSDQRPSLLPLKRLLLVESLSDKHLALDLAPMMALPRVLAALRAEWPRVAGLSWPACAYAATPEEARAAPDAGADIVVAHPGVTGVSGPTCPR